MVVLWWWWCCGGVVVVVVLWWCCCGGVVVVVLVELMLFSSGFPWLLVLIGSIIGTALLILVVFVVRSVLRKRNLPTESGTTVNYRYRVNTFTFRVIGTVTIARIQYFSPCCFSLPVCINMNTQLLLSSIQFPEIVISLLIICKKNKNVVDR